MELIKNKISIVNYFLPRNAQLVTLENYCQEPAILEGDLDQDGQMEMMALYKKDEKYYLMGLKREKKKWHVVWNRVIKYKSVEAFKLVHLQSTKKYEVAIAGKIEGMAKSQLMFLVWKEEEAQSLLDDYISFDKLYIQDVDGLDGKDEIILWQNKALEAYDVHIYRYEAAGLVEDKSLETFYYPTLVGYYEYLKDTHPEELIYKTYWEEALSKCKSSTSNHMDKESKMNKTDRDFLLGMGAYLEQVEVEEDVFLVGKYEEDEDCFIDLQLMATYANQAKSQLIRLEVEKVYDYEMKVGRFFENEKEQVFIKVNGKTENEPKKCWIIGLDRGYLYDYLQHEMYLESKDEWVEPVGEGYPIEISTKEPLMLGMKHRIWDEKTDQIVGYKLRVFKGESSQFKLYKTFTIKEEKGG